MKKQEIKPLSVVEAFVDYFKRRTKRILKIKDSEFKSIHLDISRTTVEIWLFKEINVVAWAKFTFDGRCYSKGHCIRNEPK